MKNRFALSFSIVAMVAGLAYVFWPSKPYCVSAFDKFGIKVPVCPTGEPRQLVSVYGRGLVRGGDGEVSVSVNAKYTTAKADEVQNQEVANYKVQLFLISGAGAETALPNQEKWQISGGTKVASIKLPPVDDGDYLLRAKVTSKMGEEVVDVKLPLYSPARIHVLTDRPIYEPGNLVQFRALALRARDLSPIDNRPGTWLVRSPSGEILLEEHAPAKEWGVVAGDFPLADDAEEGNWSVAWRSGASEESASFDVKPFVLPRFRVDAASAKSFYQKGDKPSLEGAVVYGSGAPVADANLEITWSARGAWPPPSEWMQGDALPKTASTGADGRFTLSLPEVPSDLRGRCTLVASISAIDPAGDRVASSATILLSEDAIQVSAVTELQGGLVENNNNRVYLRVTDPMGSAIVGASINVKRAWSPGDEGLDAVLDAEGVARIQFDPGRPVTVVVPPMPVRASASSTESKVEIRNLIDLVFDAELTLKDQIAVESWPLIACERWVPFGGVDTVSLMFRVSPSGVISTPIAEGGGRLQGCLADVVKRQRLPAGRDRLFSMSVHVPESSEPFVRGVVNSGLVVPEDLQEVIDEGAVVARSCLPRTSEREVPWTLLFEVKAKSTKLAFTWLKETEATSKMPAGLAECILGGLRGLKLPEAANSNAIGTVHYERSWAGEQAQQELKPQPRVLQGYELLVSAKLGDQEIGETKMQMQPGAVPHLRLRATPVMARPGETIELAFFRGPEYKGSVPREIAWSHRGDYEVIKLEEGQSKASFEMPKNAKGWYRFYSGSTQALVFVRSQEDLSVALSPDAQSYAPGSNAKLLVKTKIGGQGAKAAVGLFGVDNSLGQIATLRGPDDLGSVRPPIVMQEQAFGALDAQALTLGRIQGSNAAEATILRVESIPTADEVDVLLYESAESKFDPIEELTDHFYIVLAELHVQTRGWEKTAAKGETMSPKQMSLLWTQALRACEKRGQNVSDAYKRPLRLHWLPEDLLALTAPRQVVADTTRLPEDVENWQAWVAREKP